MNKNIICGRLTKDPEVRYTKNENKPICRFTVAADRPTKSGEEKKADYIGMVAFGKTAEFINQYFKKGVRILIEGSLRNNNYEDQNGVKHYGMDVWVDKAYFADGKTSGAGNGTAENNNTGNGNGNGGFESAGDEGFFPMSGDDDDLPF